MMVNDSISRGELCARILQIFGEVYRNQNKGTTAPPMTENTILLQSGLDSLGFAILVTMLEEELGFDPFSLSAESYYPQTFGELVDYYHRNRPE